MFLVGSHMCTAYSSWQAVGATRRDPDKVHREYVSAMVHMRFVYELYKQQLGEGRYFIHEHPGRATSWCMYGQETEHGEPMKKPTKLLTNSPFVQRALSRRCTGRGGACSRPKGGRHRAVEGSWAKKSQIYPFDLCKAILLGCRRQLEEDGRLVLGIVVIKHWRMQPGCNQEAKPDCRQNAARLLPECDQKAAMRSA